MTLARFPPKEQAKRRRPRTPRSPAWARRGTPPTPGPPPNRRRRTTDCPSIPGGSVGVPRRWRWIVLGALGGLALSTGVGLWRMHTRYDATFQLIKRYTPPTLQARRLGEPFKPRQFTNSTLASAATRLNVLARVARTPDPPVRPTSSSTPSTSRRTNSPISSRRRLPARSAPKPPSRWRNVWSEEIINFTREIQSEESHEIRKVIQGQLDSNETRTPGIDGTVDQISGGQCSSADPQVDTFVHFQEDIDAHYETARHGTGKPHLAARTASRRSCCATRPPPRNCVRPGRTSTPSRRATRTKTRSSSSAWKRSPRWKRASRSSRAAAWRWTFPI